MAGRRLSPEEMERWVTRYQAGVLALEPQKRAQLLRSEPLRGRAHWRNPLRRDDPAPAPGADHPITLPPSPAASERIAVLLVESDEAVATAIEAALSEGGCAVVVALDGAEGIAAYRQARVDCAVVAGNLTQPRSSQIRQSLHAADPLLPVLLLPSLRRVGRTLWVGNFGKPFDCDDLVEQIRRRVTVARHLRELAALRADAVRAALGRHEVNIPPALNESLAVVFGCGELLSGRGAPRRAPLLTPEEVSLLAADMVAAGTELAERLEALCRATASADSLRSSGSR